MGGTGELWKGVRLNTLPGRKGPKRSSAVSLRSCEQERRLSIEADSTVGHLQSDLFVPAACRSERTGPTHSRTTDCSAWRSPAGHGARYERPPRSRCPCVCPRTEEN